MTCPTQAVALAIAIAVGSLIASPAQSSAAPSFPVQGGPATPAPLPAGGNNSTLPDLLVQDIAWTPGGIQSGDNVTFTAFIKNNGSATPVSFKVRFVLYDANNTTTPLGDRVIHGLGQGGQANVTSDVWQAALGSYQIEAIVDPDDAVEESREDNNARRESFQVSPLCIIGLHTILALCL